MSINVEKRILARSIQYLEEAANGNGDNTWYQCERLDKVTHHNSWSCQQIKGLDELVESHNPQTISKLVPVSWYVPKVFHCAVLHRHFAKADVTVV